MEFRDSFQKEFPGVTLIMGLGNFSHYASIATIQDGYIQAIGMCEVMKNDAMAKWNEETNRKSLT